jgi:ubiquinol-cytochrome c reductase cytochrome b subunit
MPLVSKFEKPLPLPTSLSESVLHGEKQESAPFGLTRTGPGAAPAAAE